MYVLLGVFPGFPVDPYHEPLVWFMIANELIIAMVANNFGFLG